MIEAKKFLLGLATKDFCFLLISGRRSNRSTNERLVTAKGRQRVNGYCSRFLKQLSCPDCIAQAAPEFRCLDDTSPEMVQIANFPKKRGNTFERPKRVARRRKWPA
jgi:hypothetical protein